MGDTRINIAREISYAVHGSRFEVGTHKYPLYARVEGFKADREGDMYSTSQEFIDACRRSGKLKSPNNIRRVIIGARGVIVYKYMTDTDYEGKASSSGVKVETRKYDSEIVSQMMSGNIFKFMSDFATSNIEEIWISRQMLGILRQRMPEFGNPEEGLRSEILRANGVSNTDELKTKFKRLKLVGVIKSLGGTEDESIWNDLCKGAIGRDNGDNWVQVADVMTAGIIPYGNKGMNIEYTTRTGIYELDKYLDMWFQKKIKESIKDVNGFSSKKYGCELEKLLEEAENSEAVFNGLIRIHGKTAVGQMISEFSEEGKSKYKAMLGE